MLINHLNNKPSINVMNFFEFIYGWFRKDRMKQVIKENKDVTDEGIDKKTDTQLTRNFKLSEFDCKDGTPVPVKYYKKVKKLAVNTQVLRDYFNETKDEDEDEITITIESGYRTRKYNKKVSKARRSKHLKAMANDLKVKNRTSSQVFVTILLLIQNKKMKQGGLGLYKTFVHYDTRLFKARW